MYDASQQLHIISDIIVQIANYITISLDYKAAMQVSRQWYVCVYSRDKTHAYMNVISTFIKYNHPHMDELIRKFPNEITLDIIRYGIEHNIIFPTRVCSNPRLDVSFIRDFSKSLGNDDWSNISEHIRLNETIFHEFRHNWDLDAIVYNKTLTLDMIKELWVDIYTNNHRMYSLASNCALTVEFVMEHISAFSTNEAAMRCMMNPSLVKLVELSPKTPNPSVLMSYTSKNEGLTPDFIRKYADKLNWKNLLQNRTLTMPLIREFAHYITDQIVYNPNLDMTYIRENIDKLEVYRLRFNENLSPDFIREYFIEMQDIELFQNRAFTLELMEEFIKIIPWSSVLLNPNITLEFLQKHIDVIAI
jgi:hypothetical protein